MTQDLNIVAWAQGLSDEFSWTSSHIQPPPGVPFSCAKVKSDSSGFLLFKWYTEEGLQKTKEVTLNEAFRLPVHSRYDICYFSVEGFSPVRSVQLSTSMSELS